MNVNFIAEVSSNHNADLERSKQFIDKAAEIGCNSVKFQLFKIDKLFAPEILAKSEEHRKRKKWELPVEFIPVLSNYTHELGLTFSCTPFYLEAVDELEPYVDFYKIASYELLWHDLFIKCAKTGKPIVFSAGMATLDEIKRALDSIINEKSREITILHCTSSYPTPIKNANLLSLDTMRKELKKFNNKINLSYGWSDHTVLPSVILRAVHHFNVSTVEFHLDLEGQGEEYAAGHCWLPEQIKNVISLVNEGFDADGSGDVGPAESELHDREWRADPSDGLRPLKSIRKTWKK